MESISLFRGLVAFAFLILYIVIWTVGLVGTFSIFSRYSRSRIKPDSVPSLPPSPPLPGVTVLRPLKGLDPHLEECLESTFRQKYHEFEIILSVADDQDPAGKIARDVIAKYPNVSAKLIIGDEDIGPNPKINNLIRSYREAKYDILWAIDANTYVPPNTLRHSIDLFLESTYTPRPIQLIHHLPLCVISNPTSEAIGWGALLEEIYLSTSHAKFYIAINKFGIAPCVMGKSNLFRKSSLEQATSGAGLAKFADYIAEDHLIADALWYHTPNPGPNHGMTKDAARQPVQHETLSTYFERRVRWLRVRKYMVTSATLIEPFTECLLSSLYGSWTLSTLFGFEMRRIMMWHIFIWLCIDLWQFYTLHCNADVDLLPNGETPEFARGARRWNGKSFLRWLVCWIVRETTCLPIWIVAMCGQSVVKWRNRKFVVRSDMTVIEIR